MLAQFGPMIAKTFTLPGNHGSRPDKNQSIPPPLKKFKNIRQYVFSGRTVSLLVTTLTSAVAHAHEVESAPAAAQQHVHAWLGTTDRNGTPARLLVVAGAEDLPE